MWAIRYCTNRERLGHPVGHRCRRSSVSIRGYILPNLHLHTLHGVASPSSRSARIRASRRTDSSSSAAQLDQVRVPALELLPHLVVVAENEAANDPFIGPVGHKSPRFSRRAYSAARSSARARV